jgi:hypothetical protein
MRIQSNLSRDDCTAISLQVSSLRLLSLKSLKETLKVACSEPVKVVPLDDFEKNSRSIQQRFRENLKKISPFVEIEEDMQHPKCTHVFVKLHVRTT